MVPSCSQPEAGVCTFSIGASADKWIDEELPAVFRNSVVYTLIESLVDLAYRNAKKYMSNYVKRKTGYDIDEIIEMLNKMDKDKLPDSKETK